MNYDEYMQLTLPYVCSEWNFPLNEYIYMSMESLLNRKNITLLDIGNFADDNSYLKDQVKTTDNHIMNQPIAYLLFYLVDQFPHQTLEAFPFTEGELEPFFILLGKNLDY